MDQPLEVGRLVVTRTLTEDDYRINLSIEPEDSITYFDGAAMLAIAESIWHATNGLRDQPYDASAITDEP